MWFIIGTLFGWLAAMVYMATGRREEKQFRLEAAEQRALRVIEEFKLSKLLETCRDSGYDYTYNEDSRTWTRTIISEPTSSES